MTPIPDAALAIVTAALHDADTLHETGPARADRVAQYLISSGFTITPDISVHAEKAA
ncbi:hypothetical protein OG897_06325 [Streptomyces sp. NBC_00237]|uniref:hypothetical protein n=1 Tax=Streptomyces sp. NBC_00237 TaxID=2975687 RepID=UPI00224F89C8|nr:hypothetical protein [Streptomyces sp. NBC_00237]MCX5201078.1 hypothetical protein [Streptomyces sp. NBC_00237]